MRQLWSKTKYHVSTLLFKVGIKFFALGAKVGGGNMSVNWTKEDE